VAARPKRRAAFYIDGFNFYHALKEMGDPAHNRHLMWLNLWALADALVNKREEVVVKVVWCSAEYRRTPGHIERHRAYRTALKAVGVTYIAGHFVTDTLECRAECKQEYPKDTEKCGDVNVGIYLIADGLEDVYDTCYLISADSDQVGTVDMFQQRLAKKNKRIVVVAPPGRVHSKHMLDRKVSHRSVRRETIESCLLEADVLHPNGAHAVRRPTEYDPPAGWKRPQHEEIKAEEAVVEETVVVQEVIASRGAGTSGVEIVRKKRRTLVIPPKG
jgi:hypothetical protein